MMLKRIGYKKTALAAVAVGFVGVGIQYLSGVAGSFPVYLIGAFVSGFSMCMLNTVVNPMLNTLGGGGKKGNQLIQFGGSLNSISATIVPILVGYLMGNAANATISDAAPALWIAMGIFAVVFFVLGGGPHSRTLRDPGRTRAEKKDKHSAMSFRHFVLGTVAIFIYVGVEVGIPNFMNLFLTSTPDAATPGIGMAAAAAGSLVGTYWFLMMCGRLIGGVIGGKVSSKAQLTAVSVVALVFVLLGIFAPIDTMGRMPVFTGTGFAMIEVPIGVMFLTLCGLCTSVMWGGIFNLAVEGLGKYTSMGSGIFMVMVCGGGILPLIQGYVADISKLPVELLGDHRRSGLHALLRARRFEECQQGYSRRGLIPDFRGRFCSCSRAARMGRTPVLPVRAALVRAPAGIFAVKSAGTLSAPFITVGRNYIGHFENSSPKTGNFKVQP